MQTGKRRRQNVIASDEEEEEESANAGEDDTTIKLEISPEKNSRVAASYQILWPKNSPTNTLGRAPDRQSN